MSHDRADWHYGSDEFPDDLPPEAGATHIGMYVAWAIKRGFAGEHDLEHHPDLIASVQRGELSGRDYLMQHCDEKFVEDLLDDEGNRFTEAYYEAHYFDDYPECVDTDDAETIYHIEETDDRRNRLEATLDKRLATWRQHGGFPPPAHVEAAQRRAAELRTRRQAAPKKKPWWRFW